MKIKKIDEERFRELEKKLEKAIAETDKRLAEPNPLDFMKYFKSELEEIKRFCAERKIPNKEDKKKIVIGTIAVREFECYDQEYGSLISSTVYAYNQLGENGRN